MLFQSSKNPFQKCFVSNFYGHAILIVSKPVLLKCGYTILYVFYGFHILFWIHNLDILYKNYRFINI